MTAPVLLFAWGNPSRGDDALGPALADEVERRFAAAIAAGELEVLTDYQLQVEHALDLKGRRRVIFADATASGAPVQLQRLEAAKDESFTTHLLTPQAVLHTYEELERARAPESWGLFIKGERFELGDPLSAAARRRLAEATERLEPLLKP